MSCALRISCVLVLLASRELRQVIDDASVTAENPSGESVFHYTRHIQPLVQDPSISIGERDAGRCSGGWQVRRDGCIETAGHTKPSPDQPRRHD